MEIHGYPAQNDAKSLKSKAIPRGTLGKMYANPKKSDEIPRGTSPLQNANKSIEILATWMQDHRYPMKSNEILRGTPLQIVRKSIEIK
jgi:hypothetical protein